jgi:hypothetical protein
MKLRRVVYPLFLVFLASFIMIPQVWAGNYVGYTAGNIITQCTTVGNVHCSGSSSGTIGAGLSIQSPVTGKLVSVFIHTATDNTMKPDTVVISTFTIAMTPGQTALSCTNDPAHNCLRDNSGISGYTVKDTESGFTLTSGADNTVNLANQVPVGTNQWVSITWLISSSAVPLLQTCDQVCGTGGGSGINAVTSDTALAFGNTNPVVGSTPVTSGQTGGCGCVIGGSIQSNTGSVGTTTQCYGNCGNPPITLANTNSTHSINFNQSITLLYEFQSNLNGFIVNVTTNIAKNYVSNQMSLAIYEVVGCPIGTTPFTATCPGSRQAVLANSGPQSGRGRGNFLITNIPVANGQWVGIAITFTFSGSDVNDTNTNVSLFQTSGSVPQTINSVSSSSCTCKMALWAWITGNTVSGLPPSGSVSGNCGNGIGDFLFCLTLSFCTGNIPTPSCQLAGGFFWAMVYSGFGIIFLAFLTKKTTGDVTVVPTTVYFFVPIAVFFTFISLGALPAWVALFFFVIIAFIFADMLHNRGRSSMA